MSQFLDALEAADSWLETPQHTQMISPFPAILLVAGDKSGVSEMKFYKRLIDKADKRYKEYLDNL